MTPEDGGTSQTIREPRQASDISVSAFTAGGNKQEEINKIKLPVVDGLVACIRLLPWHLLFFFFFFSSLLRKPALCNCKRLTFVPTTNLSLSAHCSLIQVMYQLDTSSPSSCSFVRSPVSSHGLPKFIFPEPFPFLCCHWYRNAGITQSNAGRGQPLTALLSSCIQVSFFHFSHFAPGQNPHFAPFCEI